MVGWLVMARLFSKGELVLSVCLVIGLIMLDCEAWTG